MLLAMMKWRIRMNKIYIFTGKGGVGKSSIAAAHAIKSAKEGKQTLLVSTDMAHNIGDLFEVELGKEPYTIRENLDIYEIDPGYIMEHEYSDMQTSIQRMIGQKDENFMEEIGMFPGMDELFSLLKIIDLYQEKKYHRIIVDCAPTGETLSLLKFPELLSWYMEKFFPLGKVALKLLGPVSKHLFQIELPNKTAMNDIERLYLKLAELQELLKNREITSIRLVTMPERMVVEETKRNYMYMNLYDFHVDGLYINRILPSEISNEFFEQWLSIQQKYIKELKESFMDLPIYRIPWYDEELKGTDALEQLVTDVLATNEVFQVQNITKRESYLKNELGYLLTVHLPIADKKDLDLYQSETDVVIKLNNFKRNIPLPNVLRTYTITKAKLENNMLNIQFEEEESL